MDRQGGGEGNYSSRDMITGAENLLKGHCHFIPFSRSQILHEAPNRHPEITQR